MPQTLRFAATAINNLLLINIDFILYSTAGYRAAIDQTSSSGPPDIFGGDAFEESQSGGDLLMLIASVQNCMPQTLAFAATVISNLLLSDIDFIVYITAGYRAAIKARHS